MNHAPFIWASYSLAVVLLTWCALAPVFHARKLKRSISRRAKLMEDNDASNA